MDNPWDLKVSSERSSETIFIFHLFCEDQNGEPLYFEQFDGQISTLKFFHEIFKNLDEMILENNREDALFSPEDFNQS